MRIAPNCSIIFSVKQLVIYGICAMALTASATYAQTPRPQAFIEVLLNTFIDAQLRFDVQQLDAVLAPDYVEISPAGEVDPRAKVLSFYAPEKRLPTRRRRRSTTSPRASTATPRSPSRG